MTTPNDFFEDIDAQFREICRTGDMNALKKLEEIAAEEGVWLDYLGALPVCAQKDYVELFDHCLAKTTLPPKDQQPFALLLQRLCTTGGDKFVKRVFGDAPVSLAHILPAIHAREKKPLLWLWNAMPPNSKQGSLMFALVVASRQKKSFDMLDYLEETPLAKEKPSAVLSENAPHLLSLSLANKNPASLRWFLGLQNLKVPPVAPEAAVLLASRDCYVSLLEHKKINPSDFATNPLIEAALKNEGWDFLDWMIDHHVSLFSLVQETPENKKSVQLFLEKYPARKDQVFDTISFVSGVPHLEKERLRRGLDEIEKKPRGPRSL